MGKYINPFTDWGFKRIFGQEFTKALLIDFLNDLLEGERHITDVTYHDKEMLPETADQRCIIYDIYCTTDTGDHIIVEMQNRPHPYFIDRSICYASRCVVEQVDNGKEQGEAYRLLPVYTICFMNFRDPALPKFRTDVVLADRMSNAVLTDKLRFIYLTLPLFDKDESGCTSNFEKWIYVLKHMEALERIPFTSQKEVFRILENYADSHALSQDEYAQYRESLYRALDNEAYVADAEKRGYAKGEAKGMAKGMAKGEAKANRKTVMRCMSIGMSDEQIAEITDIPVADIRTMRAQRDAQG